LHTENNEGYLRERKRKKASPVGLRVGREKE
jgi:hypothetical protein